MAVAAYYAWDRDGRPITPSGTIREQVERLRLGFPDASFSWYANEAHYQAEPPEDHTPFSATGWPVKSPYPYVFATDIINGRGVDCDELFAYYLGEARAGRTPWRKYMIYKATIYDVRHGWRPQPSSGHETHIHLSDRTDWVDRSIGAWDPTGADMTPEQSAQLKAVYQATFSGGKSCGTVTSPDNGRTPSNSVVNKLDALLEKPASTPAPVDPAALEAAVQAALLNPVVMKAYAKAINDDAAARLAQ